MKKIVIILLFMAFTLGVKAGHWTPVSGPYANTATVIGVIQIDGIEQMSSTLEVGAFCGDECRGSGMPIYLSQLNRYLLFMTLYGNDGDVLSFRLYDSVLDQESDRTCTSTVTFTTNGTVGTGESPFVLNFEVVIISYPINVTANPVGGGTVTGAGIYDEGSLVTLSATPSRGYDFVHWTENGEVVSSDANYSFTATAARELVAQFSLKNYAITASANPAEGGTVTGTGTYDYGTTATLTATAIEGYSFVKWTEDGEVVSTAATYSFIVRGERTLLAVFSPNTYYVVVSADPMEGGFVSGSGRYDHHATATVSASAASGYLFTHWTENGAEVCTTPTYTFTVTDHRILTAQFISEEEHGHWTPNTGSYANTATLMGVIQIDGVEQRSTRFEVGAFCGDECRGRGVPTYVSQLDRYVLFMTLFGNDGDVLDFRLYSYELGQEFDLTCERTVTFAANGVYGSSTSLYAINFESGGSIAAITAYADPSEGGTVTGTGIYDLGATATLAAIASEGYSFVSWTADGVEVSTEATYSFVVMEPKALVAHFSLNSYEIAASIQPAMGGTVTGAGTYDHGAQATLTATASQGYTFLNWTENGKEVSTDNVYAFTVTAARNLVAVFTPNHYVITATANPTQGGAVAGTGTYDHDTDATLTATAAEGYAFVNWTEDGVEVSNDEEYTFTVSGERTLVANFTLKSYDINATANPTEGGTVTGVGAYDHGTTATLTATAATGYTFLKWTEDGETVSTASTYAFTVTGERTLVAVFKLNTYSVSVLADPMEGGNVDGAGSFAHGSTAVVTATAAVGYAFDNWTEDGEVVSTTSSYTFTVTEHRTLTAHFIQEAVSGHWVPNTSSYANTATLIGIILIDGEEQRTTSLEVGAFCGDECRGSGMPMYVPQLDRYLLFLSLYGNDGDEIDFRLYDHDLGEESNLTCMTPVSFVTNAMFGSSSDLYVLDFMLVFDITVTTSPTEGGTVTGEGTYIYGEAVTLTATAAEGYVFVNWTEDGIEVSGDSIYTFTAREEHHLMANFFELQSDADNHWTSQSSSANSMTLAAVIQLHGVEQRTTTLELGAFCGDECRGSQRPGYFVSTDRYVVWLTINGEEGETVTFRLFNHDNGEELELVAEEALVFREEGYGTPFNPYVLNFLVAPQSQCVTVPITLVSGWNWISYLLSEEIPLEEALENLTPSNGDMIKGQNGNCTYDVATGHWVGSLIKMIPGQGYIYLNTSFQTKTFSYPER